MKSNDIKKRVLLVSTSFEEVSWITASCGQTEGFKTTADSHYPLGLAYIHSFLESNNHYVETLFLNNYPFNDCFNLIKKQVESFNPNVIGLQILTANRVSSYKIIDFLVENYPDLLIVIGGIHATVMYDQILKKYNSLIAVLGEGEITFNEIITLYQKKKDLHTINGIAFFDAGKVVITPSRALIEDLDALPFPKHNIFFKNDRISGCIITTRGCPFKCSFCALDLITRRKVRYRSIKSVIDEIESMIASFPQMKEIWIHDDTFFINNKRAIDFCNEIIKRGIKIDFICCGRIKPLSSELINKLEEANFKLVLLGLETGDEGILQKCQKGITQKDTIRAFKLFKSAKKIRLHAFLMVGLPGETTQTIDTTIKFVKKLQKIKYVHYTQDLAITTIYPGTELYEIAKSHGIIDDNYWLSDKPTPLFTVENDLNALFSFKEQLLNSLSSDRINTPEGLKAQLEMLPYIKFKEKSFILRCLLKFIIPLWLFNAMKLLRGTLRTYFSRN